MSHNSVEIQNFQNPICTFVAGTIGKLYTKNQVDCDIFDGVITFSVEKAVPKSKHEKRKIVVFRPKTGHFSKFLYM